MRRNSRNCLYGQAASAERQARQSKDRCDMMLDIMTCAGRGGHETAAEFVTRVASLWTPEPETESPATLENR